MFRCVKLYNCKLTYCREIHRNEKQHRDTKENIRGVINGKAGKTAALPKFSDMLTLSHLEQGSFMPQTFVIGFMTQVGKELDSKYYFL